MSQENLKQSFSALMDNEADELELRRVLQASHDSELRAQWSRYQIARASMHNEPMSVQADLSARIMAQINAEPVLTAKQNEATDAQTVAKKASATAWLGRAAVAASVTLAVLGGVRFYNHDAAQQDVIIAQSEQRLPANKHSSSSVVLASYAAQAEETPMAQALTGQDVWYGSRLPSYLRQHAQQSSINQTEIGLPYARAASLEGQ